jgi:FkbM family methyltransferase
MFEIFKPKNKHTKFNDDDDDDDGDDDGDGNLLKDSKENSSNLSTTISTPSPKDTSAQKTQEKHKKMTMYVKNMQRDEESALQKNLDDTKDMAYSLNLPIPKLNNYREDTLAPLLVNELNSSCSMRTIRKYFELLHIYLDTFCFIKGSFVIQDNNNKLYNLLKSCSHSISFNTTHKDFYIEGESEFMEISFIDDNITINCNDRRKSCRQAEVKRLIKWYKFTQNGNTFIFAKVETTSDSLSIPHTLNIMKKVWEQLTSVSKSEYENADKERQVEIEDEIKMKIEAESDKKSCLNTFPDKKIFFKKKLLKIKKFDDLKIKDNVSFVKIDTEGYDLEVIKGMKKTIAKYHPVFLVEYNPELQKKVIKLLKNYLQYYYNIQNNSLVKIKNLNKKNFDRFGHSNSLSIRNIFFIHQDKLESI